MKSDLRTQFIHRLNGEDLSLGDRLNIAHGALLSQDFCVNGKEQIVIDWLAQCFIANPDQSKALFKMTNKCLKTDCLQTYGNTIDASRLIEAVTNLDLSIKNKYCKLILKSFLLLLKNPGFQRYCRFEIHPMCQAALLMCESLDAASSVLGVMEESTSDGDISWLTTLSEELCYCIHNVYKMTQQRNELEQRFVKSLLPALLKSDSNLKEKERFRCLISELIIGEDLQLICEAFKLETKKKIPPHIKALVDVLTKNDNKCDKITVNSLFFYEYVSSCLKNCPAETYHLSQFYIMLSVTGLPLPLPHTTVTAANLSTSEQFSILAQLVKALHRHNIPSSSESQEGNLSKYLILILKRLLSGEYFLSSELMQAVVNIFQLYPESVKPVFPLIMLHVVLVKKDNKVLKSYDHLMMTVVKTFADLNRLDKFFELFFRGAVMISKEQDFSNLTSEMILSKSPYSVLSEKLTSLTGNQMKLIIGRLQKLFSEEFIKPLENTCLQDGNFCLLLKLLVRVLRHVLENAPIVITNRWNIVSGDIHNVCLSVQRFGVAVLRGYQDKLDGKYELLLEFLQLVKVLAEVELVVNEYIVSMASKRIFPSVKSKEKSNVVQNLSKSHGFFSPQEWIYISEIVREALDKKLTITWQNLLLQKLIRLGDEDTLAHLVVEGVTEWLWDTVARVAPIVPQRLLELYTDKLISSLHSPQQLTALANINVLSNRAFRVAMTFQSLNQLAIPENSSLSGRLAKLIDIDPVMKFELEFSSEESEKVKNITEALGEAINRHSWEDQTVLTLSSENKLFYTRMFDVLSLVHSHCLKTETKRIVCLMMIGLSYDLRSETDLLPTVLDHVLGCLDDNSPVIAESLHCRVVLYWLVQVVPLDYPLRPQFYTVALGKILPTLAATADENTEELMSNQDLLCASLQALTLGFKTGRFKNTDDVKKLVKTLLSLVTKLVNVKKPKPKALRLFTLAVKTEFMFFREISSSLLSHLPKYLDILLHGLAGSDVVDPDAMELVEVVLLHQAEVAPEVVQQVCNTIARELCRTDVCPVLCYPSTVQAFFQALPVDSYQRVLMEIGSHQEKNLSSLCELWNVVVGVQEGRDKARVRDKMLVHVLAQCQKLVEEDVLRFHSNLLGLLHSIAVHRSVTLTPKLLDQLLVILGEAPTDSQPQVLHDSLLVLSALISIRAEIIFDRIPVYQQRLRKFIKSLVLLSPAEESEKLTYSTISDSSVNQVTRIIKTMTDHHAKHFARISPYLIADILHLLVTHSVETSVKGELQNCVCSLLSICDHHGTQQLQNLLPIASVELFKVVTTTFNKDYKYTGKV